MVVANEQDDDEDEGYGLDDFEDFEADDGKPSQNKAMLLNKIAKFMKRENEQAANFETGLQDIQKGGGRGKGAPFAEGQIQMGRGIKVGTQKKTTGYATINEQAERIKDLEKIVELGQSDFEDLFNMDPSCKRERCSRP